MSITIPRTRRLGPALGFILLSLAMSTVTAMAAVGTVDLRSNSPTKRDRKPSPSLSSLPAPLASGPLKILLVDDDWSDNNAAGRQDGPLSVSDKIFRRLAAEAVGGDASRWSVAISELYKNGPDLSRLRDFNVVIWYNGGSYGGNPDNSAVLSREDELTARRYLEETGGSFILVSPGFLSNFAYGNTWTDAPVPFLTEVLGINGFSGLVERFKPGVVTAADGSTYTVRATGASEAQFSGVNPDGAAIVFTASVDPRKTAPGSVPVAVAHPYGRGRFVYVGFTFENVLEPELTPVFTRILEAAGRVPGRATPVVAGVTPAPVAISTPTIASTIPVAASSLPPIIPGAASVITPPLEPAVAITERTLSTASPVTPVKAAALQAAVLKDVEFGNWGFEDGLNGWTKDGTAFDHQPTFGDNVSTTRVLTKMEFSAGGVGGDYWRDQGYNVGYKGVLWIGTFEKNKGGNGYTFGATQGDDPMGNLYSPEFQITKKYCYFLLGGGSNSAHEKVDLQIKQTDGSWQTEASRTPFRNSETMCRENFDFTALAGKIARIRITDSSAGGWGHINVDDFLFRDTELPGLTIRDAATNRTYLVDEDYPVWGIADTHAHPAHDVGFGGRLIVGRADAPLSETYSTPQCHLHHSVGASGVIHTPFIMGGDAHPIMQGWPDFIGFPRFNSRTHQQQHVEFLKRAYDGGMRLILALAVSNMYLPSLALGPGHNGLPFDDHSVTLREILAIKRIVESQAAWMEIAYTPQQARRIITEGKCAVVLGLETDNFGNFKVSSYNWNDGVGPANQPMVALTASNAEQKISQKVDEYHDIGIRQVTPIHYISGTFGGAAAFRGQIALNQFAFNNTVEVKSGRDRQIPYSLHFDYDASMLATLLTPADYAIRIRGATDSTTISSVRMTDFGRTLITKLMDKGMILDSEHMGYDTKDDLFTLATQRSYPVISSHTDPARLALNLRFGAAAFAGTLEEKDRNFGTTNIRNLATEFNLADEHYTKISRSGGTVGVFMLPYYRQPYVGPWGAVANDCAGSTKTWAQIYLYSVDKMEGRGIGIASDRGMTDFIAPRFGPNSGYALADEKLPNLKKDLRQQQRQQQRNGVRYDRPMGSFHISWYHQPDAEAIDEFENDAWIALAAIEANVPTDRIPDSYYAGHAARVINFVKGIRAVSETNLEQPFLINGDSPWEQAAAYCLQRGISPASLRAYSGYNQDQTNRLNTIFTKIQPAWVAWKAKYGNNAPLRRYRTGNRDWDFNTDGMAHYGLMPDFLQDLKNIGMSSSNLTPLMRSAEDYLRMWEKSIKASTPKG